MSLWDRWKGDDQRRPLTPRVKPVALLPAPERPRYEGEDMMWRCGRCGASGTSYESMFAHTTSVRRPCSDDDVREYFPKEVYEEEREAGREARASELAVSGIWIVAKMGASTPEGSVNAANWSVVLVDAHTGVEAIQKRYKEQIAKLGEDSTERDREKANGRYVAIDFFTGMRAEARVMSQWGADMRVAEGSHQ
jgi:hypothetical protein